ncbi:23S rRNA (guanosine(2251)-2'-O)-methyltransferase RlmB [[Clostridium] polysaccharolyticum]|uniref:RNA methyltransferase, TrmH family n=1 Tax=[Clostridium] polysaccharolyticum TaxID=29364 RepID=A0A1H9Z7X1_9FIRM|nr:23S rRNA (guanosine(2251)-2'-O)-methyltransferase RlmB [[Clostridium] polysaccharolyticum]SES76966.1 RNA methyltransferase, TrmH family [[Clostridium] polysaccharolyticum]
MISSTSNSRIKNISKLLKSSKERKEKGVFIVEGIKMFLEAKKLGLIVKAYFSESLFKDWVQDINFKEIDYEVVDDKVFREISDTITPQGVVAIVRMAKIQLDDLFDTESMCLVFLENLRDPGNLGTIVRTAEGAGISAIILSKESVDIYNPKVVRSTMGSIFRMPVLYVDDIRMAMKKAQEAGTVLYAAHLKGRKFYDEVTYEKKVGIVIGNEANGLTKETADQADCYIKIPMSGQVESLNAAVATSIIMYEVYRQRRNS